MLNLILTALYLIGFWITLRLYLQDNPVSPGKALLGSLLWPIVALLYILAWRFAPAWSHWVITRRARKHKRSVDTQLTFSS